MALTGVPVKGKGSRGKSMVGVPDMTNIKLQDQINELTETIKDYQEFVEQFRDVVNSDGDEIKKVCEEMDLGIKANSPQRDMLAAIYDAMFKTMLGVG